MRKTLREPALGLTLVVVVGLLGFFVIYPQLRVVLVPGLAGYIEFFREQTWVKPLLHSLQITVAYARLRLERLISVTIATTIHIHSRSAREDERGILSSGNNIRN